MNHSQELDQLFTALAKFHKDVPEIKHDASVTVRTKKGGSYTFSYATLGNIQNVTKPVLSKHGLSVTQLVGVAGSVMTVIGHESGQYLATSPFSIKPDSDEDKEPTPQEVGSTITYAKRYQLAGALNIDAEKDDDGNHGSGNTIEQESVPAKRSKKEDPKPKAKKEEPKAKDEPEPTVEEDDGSPEAFLESVETKADLVAWWQEKLNGDDEEEFRTKYMKQVMEKLKVLS